MTKGQKRLRNTPVFYDELKKSHTVKLTDTAWHEINKVAQQQGISASELIERWGRGLKEPALQEGFPTAGDWRSPTASSHP